MLLFLLQFQSEIPVECILSCLFTNTPIKLVRFYSLIGSLVGFFSWKLDLIFLSPGNQDFNVLSSVSYINSMLLIISWVYCLLNIFTFYFWFLPSLWYKWTFIKFVLCLERGCSLIYGPCLNSRAVLFFQRYSEGVRNSCFLFGFSREVMLVITLLLELFDI